MIDGNLYHTTHNMKLTTYNNKRSFHCMPISCTSDQVFISNGSLDERRESSTLTCWSKMTSPWLVKIDPNEFVEVAFPLENEEQAGILPFKMK